MLLSGPNGMSVNPDGLLEWDVPADAIGTYSVNLRVDDGRGGSSTQRFTLTVVDVNVNRPPVFSSVPVVEANVNTGYSYVAVADDDEGDALTYSLIDPPAGMTVDAESGEISWTPTAAQGGTQVVTIEVSDGRGGAAQQNFVISVRPEAGSHAPVIVTRTPLTTPEGELYSYDVDALDADGDALAYALTVKPDGMTIDADGVITWTPAANQLGSHDVTVRVSDARGGVATETFVLVVTDVRNGLIQGTIFQDFNADGIKTPDEPGIGGWTVYLDLNANGRISLNEPFVTTSASGAYSFNELTSGNYYVAIVGQTGWQAVAPATGQRAVTIADAAVTGIDFGVDEAPPGENHNPVFVSTAPTTHDAGVPLRYRAHATDADGDTVSYELVAHPDGMTIDPATGWLTWTPERNQAGNHAVLIRASDGEGTTDHPFTIAVNGVNTAPQITSNPTGPAHGIPMGVSDERDGLPA